MAVKGGGIMPQIIPIRDLKNTGAISQMCQDSKEPIYITKNGYGDMVIMSMQMYEDALFMQSVYSRLAESEADVAAGRTKNAKESLKSIREKYNV
jgi:PHD/YefM family antitoxin component YafN of YafNO toxin-antitoxin module